MLSQEISPNQWVRSLAFLQRYADPLSLGPGAAPQQNLPSRLAFFGWLEQLLSVIMTRSHSKTKDMPNSHAPGVRA